ncbi:hypothetical protein [Streptomyces sp. NPDC007088]|uniref:Rv1733c family protein n=1 Tax=Streptomyces sp. NPDC007088 TaxID=3364773 RepID=UPI00368520B4
MRAIAGLWRWRDNPLRRRTDLVEGWTGLLAVVLVVLLTPLAGVLVGTRTGDALQQTVRAQQQDRHRVTAIVLRPAGSARFDTDPESAGGRVGDVRVVAAWTGPGGERHKGEARATLSHPKAGDFFPVWTDDRGRLTNRPLDAATAQAHAALAGIGAATATAALLEGLRRLLMWRVHRQRLAAWQRDWARVGPDWGRAGAGS